ncbi:hypothetical protein T439DRAFT_326339 [Meredithblackwellia eburnea MCA 4105]
MQQTAVPPAPSPTDSIPGQHTSELADLLLTLRKGIEQLLERGGIDARASRQGATDPRTGACKVCRASKLKCTGTMPCDRCAQSGADCEFPVFIKRGRKKPPTPNILLLESMLRCSERAFSIVTNTQIAPKPLEILTGAAPAILSSSASSRASIPITSLLSTQPLHHPPPFQSPQTTPDYPSDDYKIHFPPTASTSMVKIDDSDATKGHNSAADLTNVIENPLYVLAKVARGIGNGGKETHDEEQGGVSGFEPEKFDEIVEDERFFENGLYDLRVDISKEMDPVASGLVTFGEFSELVDFYFQSLQPATLLLDQRVSAPNLLLDWSPFLSTAIAYISATFSHNPAHTHRIEGLRLHVHKLALRCFDRGLKSLEVVQAFLLLVQWAPSPPNWASDRTWVNLGQAMRIATEIRLDKSTNASVAKRYADLIPNSDPTEFLRLFREDRGRTWTLLFVSEISLCVSTGRLGAIVGLNLAGGFRACKPEQELSGSEYQLVALETLYKIYAKALTHSSALRGEMASVDASDDNPRQTFNLAWAQEMQEWSEAWPEANSHVLLEYHHARTILLSISLRFRGSTSAKDILDQCKSEAMATARILQEWKHESLLYSSNAVATTISYAAMLLLRMVNLESEAGGSDQSEGLVLVEEIVAALERMAAARPSLRTSASLYATRIRTLMKERDAGSSGPPALPVMQWPTDLQPLAYEGFSAFENEFWGLLEMSGGNWDDGGAGNVTMEWDTAEPGTFFW